MLRKGLRELSRNSANNRVGSRGAVHGRLSARAWFSLGLVACWLLLVSLGRKLPYLELDSSAMLRTGVLFVCFYAALLYFYYCKPVPEANKSAIRYYYHSVGGGPKGAIQIVLLNIGAPFFCLAFAYFSYAVPALATKLIASTPYESSYQVVDVERWGGSRGARMYRLSLADQEGRALTLNLRATKSASDGWMVGDRIKVIGRSWAFGTIADSAFLDESASGL